MSTLLHSQKVIIEEYILNQSDLSIVRAYEEQLHIHSARHRFWVLTLQCERDPFILSTPSPGQRLVVYEKKTECGVVVSVADNLDVVLMASTIEGIKVGDGSLAIPRHLITAPKPVMMTTWGTSKARLFTLLHSAYHEARTQHILRVRAHTKKRA